MNELITIKNNVVVLSAEAENNLLSYEVMIKRLKEKQDELKAEILKAMEENNIIKIDTEELLINYIASTDRETFDKKKFQKDNPDLYDEYVKMSKVKPQLRIKVK